MEEYTYLNATFLLEQEEVKRIKAIRDAYNAKDPQYPITTERCFELIAQTGFKYYLEQNLKIYEDKLQIKTERNPEQ